MVDVREAGDGQGMIGRRWMGYTLNARGRYVSLLAPT
jgi:hypothetical protein